MKMNRRSFLKTLAMIPATFAAPFSLFASKLHAATLNPTTPEELYLAINTICQHIGDSVKAFEEVEGRLYVHTTYSLHTTESTPKTQREMVRGLWYAVVQEVERKNSPLPMVVWREKPHFENSKHSLRMRLSVGENSKGVCKRFSPEGSEDCIGNNAAFIG